MPFNIQQKFKVKGIVNLTPKNLESLSNLYLPLIGIEAFAVYMALIQQPQRLKRDNTTTHVELLNQLNLSGPRLIQAREKLEGYGLIRTFEQVLTLESQWVYEINQPIDAEDFLNDKLLVKLLKSYLGDDQFEILKSKLIPDPEVISGNNVSKGLFDIVREDNFDQIDDVASINQPATAWDDARQRNQPALDIDLMFEMLKGYGLDRLTLLQNKESFLIFKKLYSIDDLTLIRLIQGHMLNDHQIDVKGIESSLRQTFQQQQEIKTVSTKENVTDQPKTGNLLIDQANQLSPLEFLQNIREQRGGLVTSSEQYAIEQLIKYGRLPNSVINMELYTLSVLQKRKTLPKAILEATYSDWAQAKIKTPGEAIKYIQQREQKIKQNRGASRGGNQQRETRPDWENQPVQEVSSADQAKLDQMMAQMEAKRVTKKEL